MFKRIRCYVVNCFNDIKRVLFSDKRHFFIALAALGLGLLIAFGKDFDDVEECVNFFYDIIREGETSPIPQVLRVILWTSVVYCGVFLSSVHFISFCIAGYGGIVLGSYLMFTTAFEAIACDTLCGTLYLIFYILPIVAVTFIFAVCALRGVYSLLNFSCNRRLLTNFGCHGRSLRRVIAPYCIVNLIVSLVYWLIIYIVLTAFA